MSRLIAKLHNCHCTEGNAIGFWNENPWFNGEFETVLIPGTLEHAVSEAESKGEDPNVILNPIEMNDLKAMLSGWQ